MDVHKESFSLCAYTIETEKASHYQKTDADCKKFWNIWSFSGPSTEMMRISYAVMRLAASVILYITIWQSIMSNASYWRQLQCLNSAAGNALKQTGVMLKSSADVLPSIITAPFIFLQKLMKKQKNFFAWGMIINWHWKNKATDPRILFTPWLSLWKILLDSCTP